MQKEKQQATLESQYNDDGPPAATTLLLAVDGQDSPRGGKLTSWPDCHESAEAVSIGPSIQSHGHCEVGRPVGLERDARMVIEVLPADWKVACLDEEMVFREVQPYEGSDKAHYAGCRFMAQDFLKSVVGPQLVTIDRAHAGEVRNLHLREEEPIDGREMGIGGWSDVEEDAVWSKRILAVRRGGRGHVRGLEGGGRVRVRKESHHGSLHDVYIVLGDVSEERFADLLGFRLQGLVGSSRLFARVLVGRICRRVASFRLPRHVASSALVRSPRMRVLTQKYVVQHPSQCRRG